MSVSASPTNPSLARYAVEVVRDARIPTAEAGVTLSADVYLPVGADPVPALLMANPYRKDASEGLWTDAYLRWFAERGYAGVVIDFRGIGSSGGTMRRAFHLSEMDDGVAAVEWIAAQPWCSGDVGMWGISYGGRTSMGTAARRPAALKAIIPVMGLVDAERDFVHPHGIRGGNAAIPFWCTLNLSNQLLPPLHDFHDVEQQRRWRRRLEETPWMLDFFRHGSGDPTWRECAIDASAIEIPSLCVAGWWDIFREDQIRAYEEMQGPKRLLVGPWQHFIPHHSPVERLDFLSIALRWWDRWLRGVDNGAMDGPPVTLYVQGSDAGWRGYEAWPPADGQLALGTGGDMTLAEPAPDASDRSTVIAEHRPDPTIGALSGVWGITPANAGLPLDQHDDDMRAASATSAPLPADVLIVGRPQVTVSLADGTSAERLAVRLCDVDPVGRSALITSGATSGSPRVVLDRTAYRVRAGHRLRVAVGDADFPRWWPLPDAPVLRIVGVDLHAETASVDGGTPVELPALEQPMVDPNGLVLWDAPRWEITRDHVGDGVEVLTAMAFAGRTAGRGHLFERRRETKAAVRREAPEAAVIASTDKQVTRLTSGETIKVAVTSRLTQAAVWARGEVSVDGTVVFSRVWEAVGPGTLEM